MQAQAEVPGGLGGSVGQQKEGLSPVRAGQQAEPLGYLLTVCALSAVFV